MRRMTIALAAGLLLAAFPATAQERRQQGSATLEDVPPIPPEVTAAVQRYQNSRPAAFVDWLPDGSVLISTRFATTAQLHRVAMPLGARSQLTYFGEPVAGALVQPGSNRIVLGRDTGGDEWFQLYTLTPGGDPVRITEPGTRNEDPVFSRDGSRLYWSHAVKGSGDRAILSADPGEPTSRKLVYQGEGEIAPADVSPDGRTVLISRAMSNRHDRLFLLDVASGAAREIAAGPESVLNQPRLVRDGTAVLTISDRGSDVRRLVEIDVATGRMTPVGPAISWDVESFELSDDEATLAYTINEDGFSRLVVQDFRTRRALPQPVLPKGVVSGLNFSPDGKRLGFTLASPTSPGDIWSWDFADAKLTRWTESELGPIDRADLPEPELIRFTSFDGLSVPAFVYRPKGVAAGAKTPVLISIHGGPEAQARPSWSPFVAYFTKTLGATVIVPNVRGSDGYGTRYLNLDNGPKREDSVKDIGALLDWVAQQPNLDAGRVALIGGSYGGYMVLASMTHFSDRLAGGVNLFGIGDWTTFLQNTEAYRRDNRRAEYGDERTPEMQAVFARISPRANVARITKPMLIEQGANDPRVPRSESEQLVAALRARGVPVAYLLFADEGHGWRKKPNADLSREVETVFLQRLFAAP